MIVVYLETCCCCCCCCFFACFFLFLLFFACFALRVGMISTTMCVDYVILIDKNKCGFRKRLIRQQQKQQQENERIMGNKGTKYAINEKVFKIPVNFFDESSKMVERKIHFDFSIEKFERNIFIHQMKGLF